MAKSKTVEINVEDAVLAYVPKVTIWDMTGVEARRKALDIVAVRPRKGDNLAPTHETLQRNGVVLVACVSSPVSNTTGAWTYKTRRSDKVVSSWRNFNEAAILYVEATIAADLAAAAAKPKRVRAPRAAKVTAPTATVETSTETTVAPTEEPAEVTG